MTVYFKTQEMSYIFFPPPKKPSKKTRGYPNHALLIQERPTIPNTHTISASASHSSDINTVFQKPSISPTHPQTPLSPSLFPGQPHSD
jgi:hypothetical protein